MCEDDRWLRRADDDPVDASWRETVIYSGCGILFVGLSILVWWLLVLWVRRPA